MAVKLFGNTDRIGRKGAGIGAEKVPDIEMQPTGVPFGIINQRGGDKLRGTDLHIQVVGAAFLGYFPPDCSRDCFTCFNMAAKTQPETGFFMVADENFAVRDVDGEKSDTEMALGIFRPGEITFFKPAAIFFSHLAEVVGLQQIGYFRSDGVYIEVF